MRVPEIAAIVLALAAVGGGPGAALLWLYEKPPCRAPCGVDLHRQAHGAVFTSVGIPILAYGSARSR